MNPIAVDSLFDEEPRLFAYQLPTGAERNQARVGDLVKLFIKLDEYVNPIPIWFTVTESELKSGAPSFKAKVWDRYPAAKHQRFSIVEFDSSHVYRLPMDRPEVENPLFDANFRSLKQIG